MRYAMYAVLPVLLPAVVLALIFIGLGRRFCAAMPDPGPHMASRTMDRIYNWAIN